MSRPRLGSNLSITELETILEDRRKELHRLHKERNQIQKRLEEIDAQIRELEGGPEEGQEIPHAAGRAQNEKSLIEMMEEVLTAAAAPMRVADVTQKVIAAGYKTSSANFRGIVNQALIKDKRFVCTARGWYNLKK
jgi:sugar-specific transcriptional regulator TrmB